MSRAAAAATLLLLAVQSPAAGAAEPAPALQLLPPDLLAKLAPMLRGGEMALIETDEHGRSRQLTLFAWVAAPPETVRGVVLHPERFPQFIHNVSRSEVEPREGGAFVNRWRIELPIGHFDDAYEMRPDPAPGGPVDVRSVDAGRQGAYRWEFYRAPGGGTVLVYYGRYDGFSQNFLLSRLLARNPAYGSGMAISAGLVLVKSIQREAQRLALQAKQSVTAPAAGRGPGFKELLARGTVAVVRSDAAGALQDISLVERVPVPPEALLDVVKNPDRWPTFLSSVKHCEITKRDAAGIEYRVGVAGLIVDVETTFEMKYLPLGVDALAVAGDVPGSRYRWDLSRDGDGTLAVYRANARLATTSGILRMMFRYEPLFEHSANVAVGVIVMRAMVERARELDGKVRAR